MGILEDIYIKTLMEEEGIYDGLYRKFVEETNKEISGENMPGMMPNPDSLEIPEYDWELLGTF